MFIAGPVLLWGRCQLAFFKSIKRKQIDVVGTLSCFSILKRQQLSIRGPVDVRKPRIYPLCGIDLPLSSAQ